jgi:hypothetical protein
MTTITLEVPDDLATRLNPVQKQLPDLLAQALDMLLADRDAQSSEGRERSIDSPGYSEVLDFLASGPTLEQIAEFKASPSLQDRVEELLDKNRENGLTEQEAAEMNTFLRINHIMILLKARAHKALKERRADIPG